MTGAGRRRSPLVSLLRCCLPVTLARKPVLLPRRVLVCGYYGEHNLGDDALLQALLAQLPPGCAPLVTAHDQALVQRRFGVATTDRRRLAGVLQALGTCDALLLGGGSLLQDATSFRSLLYYCALITLARLQAKPVLLWGQGLGPLRRRRSRALARWLLPMATAISWRDGESARLAADWGVDGLLGTDPVWSLPPRVWQGRGGPIVLCWRPVWQLDGGAWRPYLEALDALAAAVDRPVHWLPFHADQDGDLLDRLGGAGLVPVRLRQRSSVIAAADPDAAMAHFSGASLVIAMRLHGLILAALSGSPCAALSYDPKVAAAARDLDCTCHDLALTASPELPGLLLRQWQEAFERPPAAERLAVARQGAELHRGVLPALA